MIIVLSIIILFLSLALFIAVGLYKQQQRETDYYYTQYHTLFKRLSKINKDEL